VPRVILPDHLFEQVFVSSGVIATVEWVSGKDVGVRQVFVLFLLW
jgi:hypothetical protein